MTTEESAVAGHPALLLRFAFVLCLFFCAFCSVPFVLCLLFCAFSSVPFVLVRSLLKSALSFALYFILREGVTLTKELASSSNPHAGDKERKGRRGREGREGKEGNEGE